MTQRLIGAIVLIGLTVIFLPMLLRGNHTADSVPAAAPAQPPAEFSSKITPLEESPAASDAVTPGQPPEGFLTSPDAPPKALLERKSSLAEADAEAPGVEPAEKTVPAKPVTPKAPARPASVKPAAAKPASALPAAQDIAKNMQAGIKSRTSVSGWIVQAGSFGDEKNAVKLRDRLRTKGYITFVDNPTAGGDKLYRVRIGPETARGRADTIRNTLEKEMQIKGIVKPY